jgi:hypothetical protein
VTTGVKHGTRNPKWHKQVFELLVQEPRSQRLRVVMRDVNMLNVKVKPQLGFKGFRCMVLVLDVGFRVGCGCEGLDAAPNPTPH